jgi:cephalosporin hydroxylase
VSEPHDPKDPDRIAAMAGDRRLRAVADDLLVTSSRYRYSYNFTWLGRPIIQYPQDIVALQEVVWRVRPDVIVETGVAHGGSLVLSASLLELLGGDRFVVGIDIEIRAHNRKAIESHPLAGRIVLEEGSSTDPKVAERVAEHARGRRTMVVLDSNHTADHVLQELELYSPLVSPSSYLIVFDTVVERMPDDFFPDRPWGPGDSPATAVARFLESTDEFAVDDELDGKLLVTVAPGGYLRRRGDP